MIGATGSTGATGATGGPTQVATGTGPTDLTSSFSTVLSSTISVNVTSTSQYLTIWGEVSVSDNAGGGDQVSVAIFVDTAAVQPSSVWASGAGARSVTPSCVYAATGLSVGLHSIDLRAFATSGNGIAGTAILVTKLSPS